MTDGSFEVELLLFSEPVSLFLSDVALTHFILVFILALLRLYVSFDICLYHHCYNSRQGLTVKVVREHTADV